jgi:mannosyltransferase
VTPIRDRLTASIRGEWLGIGLFVLALGLRVWGLAQQPLWLDEVFSIQLAREGALAILRNSLSDPHPPLFYLLQWLGSGFGTAQSEWGWRWISVLSGALTIPAFYSLCRRFTRRLAAGLAGLVLAVSPFHVYYSQEARPYIFTTLLATYTSILIADLLTGSQSRQRWVSLGLLSLIGLYSSYFYLLILSVQGLVMLFHAHSRGFWLYATIVGIGTGLTVPLIVPTISSTAQQHLNSTPLTLLDAIQSLAGEPVYFLIAWQHAWLAVLLGGMAIWGVGKVVSNLHHNKPGVGIYFCLQLLLPWLILSGLQIFLGVHLPFFETRQMLIFVPALFGLTAVSFEILANRLGWLPPALISAAILAASAASLQAYWHTSKSPEGSLAISIQSQIQTGDVVVSLHYSPTAAAYMYLPEAAVWKFAGRENGEYRFTNDLRSSRLMNLNPLPTATINTVDIRSNLRLWVLSRIGVNDDVLMALTEGCRQVKSITSEQFMGSLWDNCQP